MPHHLHLAAAARMRRQSAPRLPWREWLSRHFAAYVDKPFADRHLRFWEWVSSLEHGKPSRARVECWPRGGGKSTTLELGCAYLGSQPSPVRNYVLYVSETQSQADRHVQAIAGMLERVGLGRAVNQYGASRGWKRTEVRAENGFNITAMGLDAAMRGAKLDEFRPDLIVFDDIDGRHDTPATTKKKIDTITTSILPAGSADAAVIVVQNKIHADSIVSQLCDGRAEFLHGRHPAVVEPAIRDLEYEQVLMDDGTPYFRITGGTATWEGQSLETCERQLNEWGPPAFEREAQHNVDAVEGGIWDRARDIAPFRTTMVPDLERIVVAVDPSAGGADEAGIVVAGIAHRLYDPGLRSFRLTDRPHAYVLDDASIDGGSKAWAEAAVAAYHRWRADDLVAERNNGGDMVVITIGTVAGAPAVTTVWASRGKQTRAEPVQKLYADGRIHHVGTFPQLEKEMCTWKPPMASPNRMDALVWALTDLMLEGEADMSDVMAAYAEELA